jgi:hypothetical protein
MGEKPKVSSGDSLGVMRQVLVARAMLHELERIMHPSRTLHTHVYDDFNGPTPAGAF